MNIIDKIDELRIARGWSYYKLSQETGLSQQTFTQLLNGKSQPSLNTLTAVAEAFGISVTDLIDDGNRVEITPELKALYDKWCCLSDDEKKSIELIINIYLNKKS